MQSFDLSLQRNAKNLKPVDSRANIAGLVKLSFAYISNLKGVRYIRQDILFVESTIDEVLRGKCKASF